MQERLQHPRFGEIVVSRTRRSRRISLAVRPSGEIRLSFPPHVSLGRAVAFMESKTEWIEAVRRKFAQRPQPPTLAREDIERLRAEAKAVLPQRVAELAARFGLEYGKVTVRAARTKWGSCTGRNDISLSLYLMTLPEHLRDYVIIHELCHTVHHDHSPRFHAMVDRLTDGREKLLARELRSHSIL